MISSTYFALEEVKNGQTEPVQTDSLDDFIKSLEYSERIS